MGFRSEQQLAKLLEHFQPEYRSYAARLWASGITSADELAGGSVDDLVTAGISNPTHAQDIKAKAGQLQPEYTQLISNLQAINLLLGPLQKVMQPVQVWYVFSWLANALGAVKPFSRWLVCVATWGQLIVLPVLAFVFIDWLGKLAGLMVWASLLLMVLVWWSGVVCDHQIYDLPFLQEQIQKVQKFIKTQDTAAHSLMIWGMTEDDDAWKCLESSEEFRSCWMSCCSVRRSYASCSASCR